MRPKPSRRWRPRACEPQPRALKRQASGCLSVTWSSTRYWAPEPRVRYGSLRGPYPGHGRRADPGPGGRHSLGPARRHGPALGPVAPAVATATLGLPKLGLLQHPGCRLAGQVVVVDIGIPPDVLESAPAFLLEADEVAGWLPVKSGDTHKGDSGRILIVASSTGLTGAACIAARSLPRRLRTRYRSRARGPGALHRGAQPRADDLTPGSLSGPDLRGGGAGDTRPCPRL